MVIEGAAAISASDAEGRGVDRRGLSCRHQHPAGETGAVRSLPRRRQQGRRQPGLAEGEDGLGRLVRPQSCGRGYCSTDPGRHRHQDPRGPEGDRDLGACGNRRAPGWAEGAVIYNEYGRIKTQTVLPNPDTVAMLLWALLASGQIQMRKVDGWETLAQPIEPATLDLAA